MSENGQNLKFLSDLVVYTKYAGFLPEVQRKQTWEECVIETKEMHKRKYPHIADQIDTAFDNFVLTKKVLPSMRSLQFGGLPIEMNPIRIYNCSYLSVDHPFAFAEIIFLLLCGTGVGYSNRMRHIRKLPPIVNPQGSRRFLIGDSIEGWADSIRQLIYAYMGGKERPRFDYRDIRPKGSIIKKSGGTAPGHAKLKIAHENIERLLIQAISRRLVSLEVHDIICYLSDCVLAGGVRDSACIVLFDSGDKDMMTCKGNYKCDSARIIKEYTDVENNDHGWEVEFILSEKQTMDINMYTGSNIGITKISGKYGDGDLKNLMHNGVLPWFYVHPQRGRSNNSVALRRGSVSKKQFMKIWEINKESMCGEPGIFWTNDDDMGSNPCNEIALNPYQMCNLTSVNVFDVSTQKDLNGRVRAAAFIGTLQAGYTDFHYLRAIWKETTEKEALLGVSMTGIASGKILKLNLREAARIAKDENKKIAKIIGINHAARITAIKPEGSGTFAAAIVGSGIHAIHSNYFIRSIRIERSSALCEHLLKEIPNFIEFDLQNNSKAIVSIPLKAPSKSIIRGKESAMDLLERIKKFSTEWVKGGHRTGVNRHNVSATVSVKDEEYDEVREWMWNNKKHYAGLSTLPYADHTYKQAPFIKIDKKHYDQLISKFPKDFKFTDIIETDGSDVNLVQELACSGGKCDIT